MDVNKSISWLLSAFLVAYGMGYVAARLTVFHTVEYYPEGKGGPRRDYVTKPDQPPGEGWEYQLFSPAIRFEEMLVHGWSAIASRR